MDVQVAESGPCSRTLTIKIPAAKVKQTLDQVFRSAAKEVDMKGFRKGKIPRSVLEKKYGDSIYDEAKKHLIQSTVQDACREHELVTVGRMRVDGLGEEKLDPQCEVEFQVHLDIRPEFELRGIETIEIEAQSTEVTDEDMERALKDLAGQKRTLEPIDDAVADNDFAKVDMLFKNESGDEVSRRDGAQINPSIPVAGTDPEAFRSQLVGVSKGDTVNFDLTYPDSFDVEGVRGKPGSVEITVHEVLRVQDAAFDDELAKAFEFDTMDALQEKMREQIGIQKENSEKMRQSEEILSVLVNDQPFGLPDSLVDDETKGSLAQFEERMKEAKLSEDEIQSKLDEAQDEAKSDAERRVRMYFLIDAIARKHELSLERGDVDTELQRLATQHNASIDQVREHYEKDDNASQMHLALMERKVRDFLRETATITDK